MPVRLLILSIALLGARWIPGAPAAWSDQADDTPPAPRWIVPCWDVGASPAADFIERRLTPEGITVPVIAQWHDGEQRWTTWCPSVPDGPRHIRDDVDAHLVRDVPRDSDFRVVLNAPTPTREGGAIASRTA